jgi:pimeloyl-ACP methyl ester carboxylesterase
MSGRRLGNRSSDRMKDVATSPDGIPIHFDVDGAGARAIVFVHGWSYDRTYWASQMRTFAERYRVVAIDLAGTASRAPAAAPGRFRRSAATSQRSSTSSTRPFSSPIE